MISVHVSASREYEVLIGEGLLAEAGARIREVCRAKTAVIVAGDLVWPLYGNKVRTSLEKAGFSVLSYVIPHGEMYKTLDTYGRLIRFLSQSHLTRSDVLIALGGGVTGDLTGFAAATYQRGMDFVQIPTTLLAMVDSSVGGKTAVDLETGKNQVGAFYQPSLVLCDPETLASLPEEEFRCGCAEVIKYGVLGDKAFFEQLEKVPIEKQLSHVIEACVCMKRDLVGQDEFDRGERRLLNLGHSFGHAVEARSGYQILHGQAVSIGLAAICRAAAARGLMPREEAESVIALLRKNKLPTETAYNADQLLEALYADKKLSGDTMHLVVPETIGHCRIQAVPAAQLREWLKLGGIQ